MRAGGYLDLERHRLDQPEASQEPEPAVCARDGVRLGEAAGRAVGGTDPGSSRPLGDTWEWDGRTWARITTASAPAPRFSAGMAFDAHRGRVVLYGGRSASRREADTWTYDGKNWRRATPSRSPGIRTAHTMVFDSLRSRIVLFGGFDGGSFSSETWEWDGSSWHRRAPTSNPSPRAWTAIAYDSKRHRSVMFGGAVSGTRLFGDHWFYRSMHPASYVEFGAGCGGPASVPHLRAVVTALPWIGETVRLRLERLPSRARVAVFGLGLSDKQWWTFRLPYDLSPVGMRGCAILAAADVQTPSRAALGVAEWSLKIPNNPAFREVHFFNQAVTDGGSNRFGLAFSNAVRGVIGAR